MEQESAAITTWNQLRWRFIAEFRLSVPLRNGDGAIMGSGHTLAVTLLTLCWLPPSATQLVAPRLVAALTVNVVGHDRCTAMLYRT